MTADVDVVVVGAGLAGLRAAGLLSRAGAHVALVEASDGPGGRVRSDRRDGLILDRGFQVLNTGYPAVSHCLDLPALRLAPFLHGVGVHNGQSRPLLADPFRKPSTLPDTVRAPIGSISDKARLVAMSVRDGWGPAALLKGAAERSVAAELRRRGFSESMRRGLLEPFLAGVFLDPQFATSATLFHLVWRAFVRGVQAVPAAGMQAVPDQLAAALPDGVLRLGRAVVRAEGTGVELADGSRIAARATLIATDGPSAAALHPGLPVPDYHAVTTVYHRTDQPPADHRAILLDGTGRTDIVNSVVLTNVAPSYAPAGTALVSTSVLGTTVPSDAQLRPQLDQLWGRSSAGWERVASYPIAAALPAQPVPAALRRPVRLADGLFVAGDHRDTASVQGALVSGRRAANAIGRALGLTAPDLGLTAPTRRRSR